MTCAPAVLDQVMAHARREAPAEACGILLGSSSRLVEAVPAHNLSADPNRFEIDPQDHFAAMREARRRGLDVAGFYHSHPHSAATPSPTDVAEVTYGGILYLIVSLACEPAARLFRMDPAGPDEVEMMVGP